MTEPAALSLPNALQDAGLTDRSGADQAIAHTFEFEQIVNGHPGHTDRSLGGRK
ncbi:hypothetical protein ABZ707_10570 [Streptomyces sp. NPDC006923]|uniref:hypothetical protein n=1 Tax=Streptomyces sp. NPDC006923 TaxID=3155355 RepID=UPI0033E85EC0